MKRQKPLIDDCIGSMRGNFHENIHHGGSGRIIERG